MNEERVALRQFIFQHFSLEELRTLSFDLNIEYDDLPGEGRAGKIRELIKFMERNGRLSYLHAALWRERPDKYQERLGRRVHEKTGIELIRIPAGPFVYGSGNDDKMAYDKEKPQRRLELPEFWIGRAPVTNAQFARFVDATKHRTTAEEKGSGWIWTDEKWENVRGAQWRYPEGPGSSIRERMDHPVILVSWHDAEAFCKWATLQLPIEQEWEKAARGTDGRIWPWGNNPPTADLCNFKANVGTTTPVGKYSPQGDSPYGCVDIAGNVWEWTASWYDDSRETRALRGGAWSYEEQITRAAFRFNLNPGSGDNYVGFRVTEHLADPGFFPAINP
jgi:sulfatase modifying factor 1